MCARLVSHLDVLALQHHLAAALVNPELLSKGLKLPGSRLECQRDSLSLRTCLVNRGPVGALVVLHAGLESLGPGDKTGVQGRKLGVKSLGSRGIACGTVLLRRRELEGSWWAGLHLTHLFLHSSASFCTSTWSL
jgi:hypothetical protein